MNLPKKSPSQTNRTRWYQSIIPNVAFWNLSMVLLTAASVYIAMLWAENQVNNINSKKNITIHNDTYEHNEEEWAHAAEKVTRDFLAHDHVIPKIRDEDRPGLIDTLSTIYNFKATRFGIKDMVFINRRGKPFLSLANPSEKMDNKRYHINHTPVTTINHISNHHQADGALTLVIPITSQDKKNLGWIALIADRQDWLEEYSVEINRPVAFRNALGQIFYAGSHSRAIFESLKTLPKTTQTFQNKDNQSWQIYNTPLQSGGNLYVAYDITEASLTKLKVERFALLVIGLMILLFFALGIILLTKKLKPLRTLAHVMKDIQDTGHFTQHITTKGTNEIAELTQTFNNMSKKISLQMRDQIETNGQLKTEIQQRKTLEEKRLSLQHQLIDQSHQAGKAEVANSILHNVGNVLNSVNISAQQIDTKLSAMQTDTIVEISKMFDDHKNNLATLFNRPGMHQQLADFISQIADHLSQGKHAIKEEITQLKNNVDHIKHIIAMQQDHSKNSQMLEQLSPSDLFESALQLSSDPSERKDVRVIRQYDVNQNYPLEKHKILQILVNFIRNSIASARSHPQISPEIKLSAYIKEAKLCLSVTDNGMGMDEKTQSHLFKAGFTTKKNGHGYGLHASANAAKEMQGSLTADSPGLGLGAVFTLVLPIINQTKSAA